MCGDTLTGDTPDSSPEYGRGVSPQIRSVPPLRLVITVPYRADVLMRFLSRSQVLAEKFRGVACGEAGTGFAAS
jgi:hypothetical protein